MSRLIFLGGVFLIALAFFVAIIVVANLPHSWVGFLYVVALLAAGIGGIRASSKLKGKSEARVKSDAF